MLSTTTTKKIKYNSGDSYKIVQWTGGLNCQLHDCVYFLSVSRVRAFDYVCCFCWFVCWSSLPPLMPFIHIFGISYEIILFASLCLSLSRLLSFALTRSPVDSFGRSGVPTMLLEIFFFIIFFFHSPQDFALLHSPVRSSLPAFAFFPGRSRTRIRFIIHWWWSNKNKWCDPFEAKHLWFFCFSRFSLTTSCSLGKRLLSQIEYENIFIIIEMMYARACPMDGEWMNEPKTIKYTHGDYHKFQLKKRGPTKKQKIKK